MINGELEFLKLDDSESCEDSSDKGIHSLKDFLQAKQFRKMVEISKRITSSLDDSVPKSVPKISENSNQKLPKKSGQKTSKFKREELCRAVLESHFNDYFPSCRPKFLKNPNTGRPLELDGYNARLNLAFEHQGKQHRTYPNYFHKTHDQFLKQQERDQIKRERLKELEIDLIEIPDQIPEAEIENFIKRELHRLGK